MGSARSGGEHAVRPAQHQLAGQGGELCHTGLHHLGQVDVVLQAGRQAEAGEGAAGIGSESAVWQHFQKLHKQD